VASSPLLDEAAWLRAYAHAMRTAQEYERELTHVLWVYRLREDAETPSGDIEQEIATDLHRRTLARLLRQVRNRAREDIATFTTFFDAATEVRDFLAHHYFRVFGFGEPIAAELIAYLERMTHVLLQARQLTEAVRSRYLPSSDPLYTDPRIEKAVVDHYTTRITTIEQAIALAEEIAALTKS
jgi:hypothetical protein